MDSNKKNGVANLTKKAFAIIGTALAAITGIQSNAVAPVQIDNISGSTIQLKEFGKVKPMPVLKLNPNNPGNSQFVAQHRSHASHSSHSSHYSHRSGSLFS